MLPSKQNLTDSSGREFVLFSDKRLGQGTFAEVFAGEWINTPVAATRNVAIKKFRVTSSKRSGLIDREIDIMRALDHPNIVKLITAIRQDLPDNDDDDGSDSDTDGTCGSASKHSQLFVVLELCSGGDFRRYIKGKRLSEKWARIYLLQIASGIQYLHARDIVHRDLKPHNMLLSEDKKTLKIGDFGFARVVGADALAATMCGSPLYMAPEVLRGDNYGAKADLWSVGVILYEMVCGERPFHDVASIVALRQQLLNEPIRFPVKVKETITPECRKLLSGLLQKDPEKRIEFKAFFNHDWLKTHTPPGVVEIAASRSSSQRDLASAVRLPRSTPIQIQQPQPQVRLNVINDYVDRLSSAPARYSTPIPPPPNTPPQATSVFLSVTPQGRSEPTGIKSFVDGSSSGAASRSNSRVASTFADVLSTGFGLIRDSFQSGNY